MSTRFTRRVIGLFVGLMTAVSGLAVTPAAQASPVIDPTRLGSITVHTTERPVGPGRDADVGYTVNKLEGIALETIAGQQMAALVSKVFDPKAPRESLTDMGFTLGSTSAVVYANSDGLAVFSNLAVGLYLLEEIDYGPGVVPAIPSIISVPLTDPANRDTWVYDIDVFPKHTIVGVSKIIDDEQAYSDYDIVKFVITADIPKADVPSRYTVLDPLNSAFDYVATQVAVADGTPIVRGVDYTVVLDNGTVIVDFTEQGRAILGLHCASQVVVTISVTVSDFGHIPNMAYVYLDGSTLPPHRLQRATVWPLLSEEVQTHWGSITFQKVEEDPSAVTPKPLTGAEFQVFRSLSDAKSLSNPIAIDSDDDGLPETTFVVKNADGTLTLGWLRYSEIANNQAGLDPDQREYNHYYLVETKAPAGHDRLAEPIPFVINDMTTQDGIDMIITNPVSSPAKPMSPAGPSASGAQTGGGLLKAAGVPVLLVLATVMFVGAVTSIVMARKRRNDSQNIQG